MQSIKGLRDTTITRSRLAHQASEYRVNAWQEAMEGDVSHTLYKEAKLLWDFFGGSRSKAKSFWISKDTKPRCQIESFALSVAAAHLPEGYTGAEFWVQYREGDSAVNDIYGGLDFHFDKDEEALTKSEIWKHPAVSTVTYLTDSNTGADSDIGAPLVVFATSSEDDSPPTRLCPRRRRYATGPRFSWVIPPLPGLHVAFNGSLLHGVPAELNPILEVDAGASRGYKRLSLPVNIWAKPNTPTGVQTLSDDFIKMLHATIRSQGCTAALGKLNPSPFLNVVSNQFIDEEGRMQNGSASIGTEVGEEWYQLSEHVTGDTAQLPLRAIRSTIVQNEELRAYNSKRNSSKSVKAYKSTSPIPCGVRVEYRQPAHLPVIVFRPKWISHHL